MEIKSHKDLIVWQKSMELTLLIYNITTRFPKTEIFGMTSQMNRAAVSIPSNIAEGKSRGTKKDYRQFLIFANGSSAELETQLEIALNLKYVERNEYEKAIRLLTEVQKMLSVLIGRLK